MTAREANCIWCITDPQLHRYHYYEGCTCSAQGKGEIHSQHCRINGHTFNQFDFMLATND